MIGRQACEIRKAKDNIIEAAMAVWNPQRQNPSAIGDQLNFQCAVVERKQFDGLSIRHIAKQFTIQDI